jgi:signal transduction histidine kinase
MTPPTWTDESAGIDDTERRYWHMLSRYERLLEISRNLNSTVVLDDLLGKIVLAAAHLTDTEAASIMLMSRDGTLRFEAAVDPAGVSLDSIEVPIDGSIAGWVVQNGQPLVIEDVRNEPRWSSTVDDTTSFQTRNLLAVPMHSRDKVFGCLEALNKQHDADFSEDDVDTLTTLAAQATVAIENARLFEQSDLIAEMVHELRTPLAAIKATTYLILRPELSEEKRQDLVNTVRNETDRLTRMTTEFLDLARLESGRTRLAENPVNIPHLLKEALETIRTQADEYKLDLELVLMPEDAAMVVMGDEEKLKQVTLNLLTNAVKYNREGGQIWLRAHLEPDHILVQVEDTGVGISAENLEHMFEKFYRVADSEGYTQGTGLGLAITKRIIEGHGGEIGVDSKVGEGTTFWFTLPLPGIEEGDNKSPTGTA